MVFFRETFRKEHGRVAPCPCKSFVLYISLLFVEYVKGEVFSSLISLVLQRL